MAASSRLVFQFAEPSDVRGIFKLVYQHPDPFIKVVTPDDIRMWVNEHSAWVLRADGDVVGACNIQVPATAAPAEFGGIFIHPDYRGLNLSDYLGAFALSSYYFENDPDSLTPLDVIAHVHVDNPKPLLGGHPNPAFNRHVKSRN